jgi:ribosomal protein S18 acetylase RimI-like enzyme
MSDTEFSSENFAEFLRAQASFGGGAETAFDGDNLLSFGATTQPAGPFNSLFVRRRTDAAEAVLNDAEARFSARKRGFSAYMMKHSDPELEAETTARGFIAFGELPVLLLTPRLAPSGACELLRARRVRSNHATSEFVELVAECYAETGLPRAATLASFSRRDALLAPQVHAFVFDLDGAAAAVGMVVMSSTFAGLYWIGTRPASRRRGLGAACTRMLCQHAFESGAQAVVLQAAAAAAGVYRRLGFREIGRLACYCRPHAAPTARSGLRA